MDVNLDLGRPTNQLGVGATFGLLYDVTEELPWVFPIPVSRSLVTETIVSEPVMCKL